METLTHYRNIRTGFGMFGNAAQVLLAILLFTTSLTSNAEVLLNFGVYTSDKASTMVEKFRPILNVIEKELSSRLGEPVHIRTQVAKSYEKGVEDLVSGSVDFARFGPASYISAKDKNPGINILAIESKKGRKIFQGVICVRKDSPITTVAQLKGKRFAFGNKRSTIGRYLSQKYLHEHGVNAKDLSAYEYLGRHDKVAAAVSIGQFDAGAIKEGTFKKYLKKGASLRKIASFDNVTKPWIARSGLPKKVFSALHAVLIELKDPIALKALKKDGFLPGKDTDYATIRAAIRDNPRFFR